MPSTTTLSISAMNQAIEALDSGAAFQHISYNLTTNNSLPSPWWVFMPYGQWSGSPTAPNPSPFENAILQAIPASAQTCFIDIMHVQSSSQNFWADPNAHRQIAPALASFINSIPTSATPVVRYLVGQVGSPNPHDDGLLQALFFSRLVTHPNAWFYYGNFSPGFQLSQQDQTSTSIRDIWQWLVNEIRTISTELYNEIVKIKDEIETWIQRFVQTVAVPSLSWNHAKIFCVNGTNLVAAGANYWDPYTTGQTTLFDMGMSITGDAAVDAHRFANFFWHYLGNIPFTDRTSWSQGAKFGTQTFGPAAATLWSGSPQSSGRLAALTVGKSGLWPTQQFGYPIQIFDAVRDFVINILAVIAETHVSARVDLPAMLTQLLSDDNSVFHSFLGALGVSPAAWASRYTRNYAARNAQKVMRFSQQKFVLDDLVALKVPHYSQLVADVNRVARINWDGYIWPFDMLLALGYGLAGIRANVSSPTGVVQIVNSYLDPGNEGYQDSTSAAAFKARLTGVMAGMAAAGYINVPAQEVAPLVASGVVYKRVDASRTNWQHWSHCKMVLVDDAVCYIGSDNAYPSYNQEFGIWVDDPASLQALVSHYWDGLWSFAKEGP